MKLKTQELGKKREDLSKIKEELAEKRAVFNKQHEELIDNISKKQEIINDLSEDIRENAITKYKESGEKTFDGGVKIRIMSQLEYDNGKAFSWAKEHNLALNTTLNKKAFEKFVKAEPTKFEFVTLVETPSATIPTKIEIENTLESGENIK